MKLASKLVVNVVSFRTGTSLWLHYVPKVSVRYVFISGRVKRGSTLGPWKKKAVCLVASKLMLNLKSQIS